MVRALSVLLGSIHTRRRRSARAGSRCFCCFCRKFISERHRVLRGNPGLSSARRSEKQRDLPLFSAVFRCFPLFSAVFITATQELHKRPLTGSGREIFRKI